MTNLSHSAPFQSGERNTPQNPGTKHLAYWAQADDDPTFLALRRQPTHLPGILTRAEVIAYYSERTGLPAQDMRFYLVYGLFRLAVIVQQIYYRYAQSQTKNEQFAGFGKVARYLEQRCLAALAADGPAR